MVAMDTALGICRKVILAKNKKQSIIASVPCPAINFEKEILSVKNPLYALFFYQEIQLLANYVPEKATPLFATKYTLQI